MAGLSVDRRGFVLLGCAICAFSGDGLALAAPPDLLTMMRQRSLSSFYRMQPPQHVGSGGLAGFNESSANAPLIEEQRAGTELIIHGMLAGRDDWVALGWRALDVGIDWQEPDGGFGSRGYFHSNSLFVEGLARACLVDPAEASAKRKASLAAAARWLAEPSNVVEGMKISAPYTHRRYVLAAALGQSARVLGDPALAAAARGWANAGLALQRPNGENPELGGGDANYQMAGILMALRYYPSAPARTQTRLRAMIRRGIGWELPLIGPDGRISTAGSTRVGVESVAGRVKTPNYPEIYQALHYADAIMPTPAWRDAATAIGRFYHIPA